MGDRILAEDDLRRALKAKAEETIYDLFLWPSGQFEFREGEFPENIHITFETPVTPVILEGIRRVDEWQRIRTVFSSMDTTFKAIVQPAAVPDAVDRQLLGFAAAGRSLAEMSLELREERLRDCGASLRHARARAGGREPRAGRRLRGPIRWGRSRPS